MGPKLAAALVAAQSDLRAIAKDSTNPHFKNRYASLDAIIEAVRPALAQHGIAVVQSATSDNDGKALIVATMLVHISGEEHFTTVYVPLVKLDPQGAGGALTYGRRYGLSAALCLSTDEDDDGNHASTPRDSSRQSAKRATRPAETVSVGERGNEPERPSDASPEQMAKGYAPPHWLGLAKDRPMPFGNTKGKPLGDHSRKGLESVAKWCEGRPGFEEFRKDLLRVAADMALGIDTESADATMGKVQAEIERDEAPLSALLDSPKRR